MGLGKRDHGSSESRVRAFHTTPQPQELMFLLRAVPTPPTAGTQVFALASRSYFSFLEPRVFFQFGLLSENFCRP